MTDAAIEHNFKEHLAVINELLASQVDVIEQIAQLMVRVLNSGGKILIAGNGGSAADAQHIAGELVGRYLFNRPALPAVALSTDTSVLTCVANDFSYDDIFVRQIEALANQGDLFWAISTSGNSANVIKAAKQARELKVHVVGFTGRDGGPLKVLSDLCLTVPHDRSNRIQEGHQLAYHIICQLVERAMFARQVSKSE